MYIYNIVGHSKTFKMKVIRFQIQDHTYDKLVEQCDGEKRRVPAMIAMMTKRLAHGTIIQEFVKKK